MRCVLFALSVATVCLAGCGGGSVVPVSGRVTLDGKPLAGVHIAFQPIAQAGQKEPGVGSYALTDANGQFTLLLIDGERPGAVVGKHRVEIIARAEVPADVDVAVRPITKVNVPAKYNRNSELTFEVPSAGTDAANFELRSN